MWSYNSNQYVSGPFSFGINIPLNDLDNTVPSNSTPNSTLNSAQNSPERTGNLLSVNSVNTIKPQPLPVARRLTYDLDTFASIIGKKSPRISDEVPFLPPNKILKPVKITKVAVMPVYQGKLIVYRKSDLIIRGGFISTPGGIVLPNETTKQAAVRHMKQKAGIHINENNLVQIGTNKEGDFACYRVIFTEKPTIHGPDSFNQMEVDKNFSFNGLNYVDIVPDTGFAYAPISCICPWLYNNEKFKNSLFVHFVSLLRESNNRR